MPQTHKRLGQVTPTAATNTQIYAPAASTDAILTSLLCSNHGGVEDTIRVFNVPAGEVSGTGNDIYYDIPVPVGDSFLSNPATVLTSGDKMEVYSLNGTTTFTFSGLEITP